MRAYDYFKNLPVCYSEKMTMLAIMLDLPGNMSFGKYCSVAKNTILPDDFSIPKNYLELMSIVNCMVKDRNCPNNLRNRFYDYKGRVIKEVIKQGRVSDVWDEGGCISLKIDNEYRFHQLKNSYAGVKLTPVGVREYKRGDTNIKFNPEVFKQFQLAAIYFLSNTRFTRQGHKEDPKCLYGVPEKRVGKKGGKNLGLILERSRIPFASKVAILSLVLYGNTDNSNAMSRDEYETLAFSTFVPNDFTIPKEPLELMVRVNRMVKDEKCPKNLKNRFYNYKKRIIHVYSDYGKISDVWDERDTWSVLVDKKYRFHQLKREHPRGYPKYLMGTREFVGEPSEPFDEAIYNEFQVSAVYFLGRHSVKMEDALEF